MPFACQLSTRNRNLNWHRPQATDSDLCYLASLGTFPCTHPSASRAATMTRTSDHDCPITRDRDQQPPAPLFTSSGCVVAFALGLMAFPLFAAALGIAARVYRFTAGVPSP